MHLSVDRYYTQWVSTVDFFSIFFWRATVCWPLLNLGRPFLRFFRDVCIRSQSAVVVSERPTSLSASVADPEFLSRILDTNLFHPGSKGQKDSRSRIRNRIKELSTVFLAQKIVSELSEIWFGIFIPDPDLDILPIPDPEFRGQKGAGSRILNTVNHLPLKT